MAKSETNFNACLWLDYSAIMISSHSALQSLQNVDVECAAFKLVNMCSGNNFLMLDLLDCEDILLCSSGSTNKIGLDAGLVQKPTSKQGAYSRGGINREGGVA